jgi:zinc D-Ala-D-Ala dipeptidase
MHMQFYTVIIVDNFMNLAVYPSPKCFLRPHIAEELRLVQEDLSKIGLGLKVWDAYRPLSVQRKLWDMTTDKQYVADPYGNGSNHNRGAAIDLTLVDLATKEELEMPTPFDEFTTRAHSNSTASEHGITEKSIENRALLNNYMSRHNFHQLPDEWWHFNYKDCETYDLMDIDFDDVITVSTK